MEEFNAVVMDHFLNPRNAGDLSDATMTATLVNDRCGDVMKLWVRIEGGVIREAKTKTFGCAVAIAASSVLTELLKGRPVEKVADITNAEIIRLLGGVPPGKELCSILAEQAVGKIRDYTVRQASTGSSQNLN